MARGGFMTLDGNPAFATNPGQDAAPQPISYWVDGLTAAIGADGVFGPDEKQEVMRLLTNLQAIAQQKSAAMGGGMMPAPASNETSDFGSGDDTEDAEGFGPGPGAQFMGPG